MDMLKLYNHQIEALNLLKDHGSCAIGYGMGLGKTFIASEKMKELNADVNLVICQKSKIDDWLNHFVENYPEYLVLNLTQKSGLMSFISWSHASLKLVGVINYDLVFRKPELLELQGFTMILDESSMIQHANTKRTKFIMKLQSANTILLSGTFTNGKLENLWTQAYLTGYDIDQKTFESMYCVKEKRKRFDPQRMRSIFFNQIVGYKNEERLFKKLRENGWIFKKTEDAIDLPSETFVQIKVPLSKEYKKFKKNKVIDLGYLELIGDTPVKRFLYYRMLAGYLSSKKLEALEDLLNSTNERVIIFYNFKSECNVIENLCEALNRPVSYMNGSVKDMTAYDDYEDSVTLIQYQSGSFGLNLQKCCHTIYFSPPLSTEHYEQSKARTRRIGQERSCFYYQLIMSDSIENHIYKVLDARRNFNESLFEDYENE